MDGQNVLGSKQQTRYEFIYTIFDVQEDML